MIRTNDLARGSLYGNYYYIDNAWSDCIFFYPDWRRCAVFFFISFLFNLAMACPPGSKCGTTSQVVTPVPTLATVQYFVPWSQDSVTPEKVFYVGDLLWMKIQLQQSGYVYVSNVGEGGKINKLYPLSGQPEFVFAERVIEVGAKDRPLVIVPPVGQEDLYLIYSTKPLDDLAIQYIVIRESQGQGRIHLTWPENSAVHTGTKSISAQRSLAPQSATYSFDPTADGAQVAYFRIRSAYQ